MLLMSPCHTLLASYDILRRYAFDMPVYAFAMLLCCFRCAPLALLFFRRYAAASAAATRCCHGTYHCYNI